MKITASASTGCQLCLGFRCQSQLQGGPQEAPCFPGCQIPATPDPPPKQETPSASCEPPRSALYPPLPAGVWRKQIKCGSVSTRPQSRRLPWPPLGIRAWSARATGASREGPWAEPKVGMSLLSEGREQLSCPAFPTHPAALRNSSPPCHPPPPPATLHRYAAAPMAPTKQPPPASATFQAGSW